MTASKGSAPEFHSILGKQIEVAYYAAPQPRGLILLLHEALGSVSYWRDFPDQLVRATGCHVLSYSRPGHGNSEGPLEERDREHYERQVDEVIPALLAAYGATDPILYGHSEGAAIAMLYAASGRPVRALILESPHLKPEKDVYKYIQDLINNYAGSRLQSGLGKYHRDADSVFSHWAEWVLRMNVEDYFPRESLSRIRCPVLVLQGDHDEFGTRSHMEVLRQYLPDLQLHVFAGAGHLPHREQSDALLAQVAQFLTKEETLHPVTSTQESPEPSKEIL